MNEFQEFLRSAEAPNRKVFETSRLDTSLAFRKASILRRFFSFQFLGAIFSLSLCPQFGLGLIEGHGITHYFRMIGDWACAVFCASVFISSGSLLAYVSMKGEELWWVWRHYKSSCIFLPAILWMLLMLTSWDLRLQSEEASYHLIWILASGLTLWGWGEFYSKGLRVEVPSL